MIVKLVQIIVRGQELKFLNTNNKYMKNQNEIEKEHYLDVMEANGWMNGEVVAS